jgi:hypothetical protein
MLISRDNVSTLLYKGEIMQYQAKTKQDRVYLSGLLKDEKDPMPQDFLRWWSGFCVGYNIQTATVLSAVNNGCIKELDWISWLVRQGIIEVKQEIKQVTFKRQTAFSGKPITINPAEYAIEFYYPKVPNTVHVKFFRYNWNEFMYDNVAYFVVELTPEVLEKINLHKIKIRG